MTKNAVIICGQISHEDSATEEFIALAGHMRKRLLDFDVENEFLEFTTPLIRGGLERLKERGAERIICLPGMWFAHGHVKDDLHSEINGFAAENPEIEVLTARDLAIDSKLLKAASDCIEQAEKDATGEVARANTLLMVVGRGTNDPKANSNVSKIARMLWEGMGFGWAEVSYSDAAYPLFDACMAKGIKLGFKRIIVFPYFLFTGTLVRRIYTWADKCQAAHPEIEIINASYLTDHEQLLDCFVDRIREALDGDNNMNCLFCKYREQIVGDELDQGELQAGHDHAAGIGIDGHGAAYDGVHGYGHSHEHPHGHSHKQGKSDAS